MSNTASKPYTPSEDIPTQELLQGNVTTNNAYVNPRQRNGPVSVMKDEEDIDQPRERNAPNSNERLYDDDAEAINERNVMKDRTRHAAKRSGAYREPRDNEGIPNDTGRSSTR